jgi:zinc transport system substrate-binding protein
MYAFAAVICISLLSGCGDDRQETPGGDKKISAFVSIPPLAFFVERIAGGHADVQVLVGPGQSPVTFEPAAKQMSSLARADVFFTVGVPFEEVLLPRIRDNMPRLDLVDTRAGIQLRDIAHEPLLGQPVGEGSGHVHHGPDPHVWLNPRHARTIAHNVYQTLVRVDSANTGLYESNYRDLVDELERLDEELTELLAPLKGTEIVVYHPAYGYFAEAYGLKQVAIEKGGVPPGSKHLASLLKEARQRGVKAIFVQPQFSRSTAETLARAIGARVITIDPLSADYVDNLRELAIKIHSAYGSG